MEPLFLALLLSGVCLPSSLAFMPPREAAQPAWLQVPPLVQGPGSKHAPHAERKAPAEERELVKTVRVSCHPDSMVIVIKADLFGVGAPVNVDELRLGADYHEACRAAPSSADEYTIAVGLTDCGTKHWMTQDSLVYTNLLLFSPVPSRDGLIRMDEAVVPIECHYERKYSLSSSSLTPTWVPFMSTQSAVETLPFDLRIMTNDWLYEKGSNVFHLGEPINIEASVRVGHHLGLRVFVSSCVATLEPDIYSAPRYVFVENGCLVDSQLLGSRSYFLPRTEDAKLSMVIDAFKFHNEDRGELYITCHLSAVPLNDAQSPNKACTFVGGRWRSADANDILCGHCRNQNEDGQTHSEPGNPAGKFGPRGFVKPQQPESFWRSGLKTNIVMEQEAKLGPVLVLPWTQNSGPLPVEELPPVLSKISRPSLYGSQWRSRTNNDIDLKKGLLPDLAATPEPFEEKDDTSGMPQTDGDAEKEVAPVEMVAPVPARKSEDAAPRTNSTAAPSSVRATAQVMLDGAVLSNATAANSGHTDARDPKR